MTGLIIPVNHATDISCNLSAIRHLTLCQKWFAALMGYESHFGEWGNTYYLINKCLHYLYFPLSA